MPRPGWVGPLFWGNTPDPRPTAQIYSGPWHTLPALQHHRHTPTGTHDRTKPDLPRGLHASNTSRYDVVGYIRRDCSPPGPCAQVDGGRCVETSGRPHGLA